MLYRQEGAIAQPLGPAVKESRPKKEPDRFHPLPACGVRIRLSDWRVERESGGKHVMSRLGQTLSSYQVRSDVTADGRLNNNDIGFVKSSTALPEKPLWTQPSAWATGTERLLKNEGLAQTDRFGFIP